MHIILFRTYKVLALTNAQTEKMPGNQNLKSNLLSSSPCTQEPTLAVVTRISPTCLHKLIIALIR